MAHSNGKITAPVGIDADIAPVLGVGSYDLGYLCSNAHGKINPWARYKPVRYESLAPGENEKWWQGWDGNCGIMPKRISSYQDSVNWANGSMNGWEYTPPTGGKFPFRALDFDVPAGTTKEMEITVSVSSQLVQAKNAKLWVSLNSASYIGSSIFMVALDQ